MNVTAYIALGSNLGDRRTLISQALEALTEVPGILLTRCAAISETEPAGPVNQGLYLNTAAEVSTSLSPRELLASCLEIENRLGRVRTVRWGPRTIDLDLLLYGNLILKEPGLIIPHPEMTRRAFVLQPLAEMAPDLLIPGTEQSVRFFLKKLEETS